eukprot:11707519-Karenia_brevis.AAC.1
MLQRRFARTGDREDDGLKNVTKPNQMYSSDHLIVAKSKEGTDTVNEKNRSASGDVSSHTVRDTWSGCCMIFPSKDKDTET